MIAEIGRDRACEREMIAERQRKLFQWNWRWSGKLERWVWERYLKAQIHWHFIWQTRRHFRPASQGNLSWRRGFKIEIVLFFKTSHPKVCHCTCLGNNLCLRRKRQTEMSGQNANENQWKSQRKVCMSEEDGRWEGQTVDERDSEK